MPTAELSESVRLVNLVVPLRLADEVDQRLAQLRVEMLDDVLFLRLRKALQKGVPHLRLFILFSKCRTGLVLDAVYYDSVI